jgi:hypothetical protein
VYAAPLAEPFHGDTGDDRIAHVDTQIRRLLAEADSGFALDGDVYGSAFFDNAWMVLRAHHLYQSAAAPEKFERSLAVLAKADTEMDWVVAAREWVERRQAAWERKMAHAETA